MSLLEVESFLANEKEIKLKKNTWKFSSSTQTEETITEGLNGVLVGNLLDQFYTNYIFKLQSFLPEANDIINWNIIETVSRTLFSKELLNFILKHFPKNKFWNLLPNHPDEIQNNNQTFTGGEKARNFVKIFFFYFFEKYLEKKSISLNQLLEKSQKLKENLDELFSFGIILISISKLINPEIEYSWSIPFTFVDEKLQDVCKIINNPSHSQQLLVERVFFPIFSSGSVVFCKSKVFAQYEPPSFSHSDFVSFLQEKQSMEDYLKDVSLQADLFTLNSFHSSFQKEKREEVQGKRILSIQSHVVHGYVGNKSAVFPLQLHGYDVDILNTVQFSNHTGYKNRWGGSATSASDFQSISTKLSENDILSSITHVLQGYCPSLPILNEIYNLVTKLRSINPSLCYICDPVMGDNGKSYVAGDLISFYSEKLVPLANIITPNQYEVELLVQFPITNEKDALLACEQLHQRGVSIIIITSVFYSPDEIILIGSSKVKGEECRFRIVTPKLHSYYTGTGDLFASLLLCWMIKLDDVQLACERAVAGVRAVLTRTTEFQKQNINQTGERYSELRLIQSREDLENPKVEFFAQLIED